MTVGKKSSSLKTPGFQFNWLPQRQNQVLLDVVEKMSQPLDTDFNRKFRIIKERANITCGGQTIENN